MLSSNIPYEVFFAALNVSLLFYGRDVDADSVVEWMRCCFVRFQVKIWFQNRRTKWKKHNPGLDANAPPSPHTPESHSPSPTTSASSTSTVCQPVPSSVFMPSLSTLSPTPSFPYAVYAVPSQPIFYQPPTLTFIWCVEWLLFCGAMLLSCKEISMSEQHRTFFKLQRHSYLKTSSTSEQHSNFCLKTNSGSERLLLSIRLKALAYLQLS